MAGAAPDAHLNALESLKFIEFRDFEDCNERLLYRGVAGIASRRVGAPTRGGELLGIIVGAATRGEW